MCRDGGAPGAARPSSETTLAAMNRLRLPRLVRLPVSRGGIGTAEPYESGLSCQRRGHIDHGISAVCLLSGPFLHLVEFGVRDEVRLAAVPRCAVRPRRRRCDLHPEIDTEGRPVDLPSRRCLALQLFEPHANSPPILAQLRGPTTFENSEYRVSPASSVPEAKLGNRRPDYARRPSVDAQRQAVASSTTYACSSHAALRRGGPDRPAPDHRRAAAIEPCPGRSSSRRRCRLRQLRIVKRPIS